MVVAVEVRGWRFRWRTGAGWICLPWRIVEVLVQVPEMEAAKLGFPCCRCRCDARGGPM